MSTPVRCAAVRVSRARTTHFLVMVPLDAMPDSDTPIEDLDTTLQAHCAAALARGEGKVIGVKDGGLEIVDWNLAGNVRTHEALADVRGWIDEAPGDGAPPSNPHEDLRRVPADLVAEVRAGLEMLDLAAAVPDLDDQHAAAVAATLREKASLLVDLPTPAGSAPGTTGRAPGTRVVHEIDHDPVEVDGVLYLVRESAWNSTTGRSFDVFDQATGECLTVDESLDRYPTGQRLRDLVTAATVECKFCDARVPMATARRHDGSWVGADCCWDDHLYATS